MTREDLLHAIGTVEESRLARCEKNRVPSMVISEEDTKMNKGKFTKRKGIPKVWLIAAIISAMVFMMGCAWVVIKLAESPLFNYPLTESAEVDPDRIHLVVSNVTSTSMQITCSIDGVERDKDAIYILRNGPFTLEKQTDAGWEQLTEKISDPLKDPDEVLTDGTLEWL